MSEFEDSGGSEGFEVLGEIFSRAWFCTARNDPTMCSRPLWYAL
jgi:hypothetical protein